jgi:hypothetical protein
MIHPETVPDTRSAPLIRCPALTPSSYLMWASWWYRVNAYLQDMRDDMAGPDLEVIEQVGCWERLLDLLSKQLPKALMAGHDALTPTLRASRSEAGDAARVARSRLAWVHDADLVMLRPEPEVARVMEGLIAACDARADAGVPLAV